MKNKRFSKSSAKFVRWLLAGVLCMNMFTLVPESAKADNVDTWHNDAFAENGGWLDFGAFTVTETEILQDSVGTGTWASTFHADATYYTKVHGLGGQAALSGWAWSDSIGWIKMSSNTATDNSQTWATIVDPASQDNANYGVYIDTSGYFRGYAWSETAGWVSFYEDIHTSGYTATTWRASSVPDAPILVSPSDSGKVATTAPTLTFNLNDPDGDAVKFQIQIGPDAQVSTGSRIVDFTEVETTELPRNNVEYKASGLTTWTYYWRVRAIDSGTLSGAWSEIRSFQVDVDLPVSKILYPQDKRSLKNVNYILGKATDNDGVDFTRVSIRNMTTGKYYDGADFTEDTETWITVNTFGSGRNRTRWYMLAPTWTDFQSYTIRSRATDVSGNEEHTDAITFTYDTVNGSEGSIYTSNPGVDNNSDYKIYYPNTNEMQVGSAIEVDFDDSFAFSPWMDDASIVLSNQGGDITASTDTINRVARTIRSTTVTGVVPAGDMFELEINNLMIHNPSATGSYVLPIRLYNHLGVLVESGTGTITLVENYQQVEVNVDVAESLQLRVDSGSVLLEVDPDVQLGQNWTGTGGAVLENTEVEVKTNAQNGYNLMISLAGNTATGSAVLDGAVLSGSQITSTAGDRVSIENNFTFGLNTGTSGTVTAFQNASTQVSGAGSSNATNSYIDNIFYYLNIDYTTPSDTYGGTVTYTAVGQF